MLGNKGFNSLVKAKHRFVTLLTDLITALELEKREDGLDPIPAFWEEYLPALAPFRL